MGYAILNRLIGLVNKTIKMSFFQENFHFHKLSWVLTPKKRTSLKEDSNWIDILKPRYIESIGPECRCFEKNKNWQKNCGLISLTGSPVLALEDCKCLRFFLTPFIKNLAYGRQSNSQPMRIVAPTPNKSWL